MQYSAEIVKLYRYNKKVQRRSAGWTKLAAYNSERRAMHFRSRPMAPRTKRHTSAECLMRLCGRKSIGIQLIVLTDIPPARTSALSGVVVFQRVSWETRRLIRVDVNTERRQTTPSPQNCAKKFFGQDVVIFPAALIIFKTKPPKKIRLDPLCAAHSFSTSRNLRQHTDLRLILQCNTTINLSA